MKFGDFKYHIAEIWICYWFLLKLLTLRIFRSSYFFSMFAEANSLILCVCWLHGSILSDLSLEIAEFVYGFFFSSNLCFDSPLCCPLSPLAWHGCFVPKCKLMCVCCLIFSMAQFFLKIISQHSFQLQLYSNFILNQLSL